MGSSQSMVEAPIILCAFRDRDSLGLQEVCKKGFRPESSKVLESSGHRSAAPSEPKAHVF